MFTTRGTVFSTCSKLDEAILTYKDTHFVANVTLSLHSFIHYSNSMAVWYSS